MYSPLYAKPTSKKTRLLRQHIEEVVSHHKVTKDNIDKEMEG